MRLSLLALSLFIFSCARAPLEDPQKAFLPSAAPVLADSLPLESLREGLQRTLAAYETSKIIPAEFRFSDRRLSREDYRLALLALVPELTSFDHFHEFVRENFDFYEVYGRDGPGEVFSTGYYEALMPGSRTKTKEFSQPLYKAPPDLVTIDLGAFALRYADLKPLQELIVEQKSNHPNWKGRLEGRTVVPYYNREEIESAQALAGKNLEIAWVNPIDAFFLEIQGSGSVILPNGKRIRVGYGGQNGWPYEAIGKHLYHVIPKEQMSMQRIRQYLETLGREQQQEIFNLNPSFVFFEELKTGAMTYSGAVATAGRTIASDQYLFPKGTLGFLNIELPVFADAAAYEPAGWESRPRWVFDQDTGGGIRGGGRIDLFMGEKPEEARMAGVMKRDGHYWVVAPKESFLQRLRAEAR